MQITNLFIDLDDTVYPAHSGLWELIKQRISLFMYEKLSLDWEVIPGLRSSYYKNYGTTIRGLMADYDIDMDQYLQYVHDVPLSDYLKPDPSLQKILERLPQRKIIFTNADAPHAQRVLSILGIEHCFEKIIDIHTLFPYCKPLPDAYQIALNQAGENNAASSAFLDDSISNLSAAKQIGFFTIRVGSEESSVDYDTGIIRIHDICRVIEC